MLTAISKFKVLDGVDDTATERSLPHWSCQEIHETWLGVQTIASACALWVECPLGSWTHHELLCGQDQVDLEDTWRILGPSLLLLEQHATVPVTPGAGSSEFGLATSWGGGLGPVPFQNGFGRACTDDFAVSPDCLSGNHCAFDFCRTSPVRCRCVPGVPDAPDSSPCSDLQGRSGMCVHCSWPVAWLVNATGDFSSASSPRPCRWLAR